MFNTAHDRAMATGAVLLSALALAGCHDRVPGDPPPNRAATTVTHQKSAAAASQREPAAPDILVYRDVTPQAAVALNAAMPVSAAPVVAARPFRIGEASSETRAAATDCMTAAVFYEAAGEGDAGQAAVAQVVLNRLRHPAFPKTVCGVVFQGADRRTGCQFTFTCDGSLSRLPSEGGWARARRIAQQAIGGVVDENVGLSTHYHTRWVAPYWRTDLTKLALVGAHIFYRWQGGWGTPKAFSGRYGANEALPQKLAASLPADYLLSDAPGTQALVSRIPAGDLLQADMPTSARRLLADKFVRLRAARRKVVWEADEKSGRLMADEKPGQLLVN